ncbi:XamI family restriction endonuclease [Ralstonia solanacearum]|uniref:XamI family restriction endonuclease n=1 Tax=Ralstonia solanacearum TaxID=305 RepID=UPI002304D583|nr:XamI family restriction endonuclease [Ralstonia solanacearum]MDB0567596.1 XamI family restriction endonuclease [Ralstonia solanacearum]MDB0578846.1 XamI family restriction endonuclease [Ralstonia solanacearum]
MSINRDKPDHWKADIKASVDLYNAWFMDFAPQTFRDERVRSAKQVENALKSTANLTNISPALLKQHPEVLPMLRMATCPPIARDRLIGLAGVSKNLVKCMEDKDKPGVPPRMSAKKLDEELTQIGSIITRMADRDIFVWLESGEPATETDVHRAATIVADRLCGAQSDPIIRNEQENRQLRSIAAWLNARDYKRLDPDDGIKFNAMPPGTYSFRMNVPVALTVEENEAVTADAEETEEDRAEAEDGAGFETDVEATVPQEAKVGAAVVPEAIVVATTVNIPVDVVIMPKDAKPGDFPLLIEAKSAGDFTNVNKRRKEEAQKIRQLKRHYHQHNVRFGLFLCGYFDSGYLGYAAADGIDWVWEHRIDDLAGYAL